ncbi:MAG: 1,4-dihydroxy-2-naphthoate polyprenyltransferase [Actinomycetales bacterium]|nr:1,4-dihydroxy-2-naphthoate polyprenyltransferase [Actinomycetales bacterium]
MASVTDWLEGARLRTLPAAVAPVALGTASAWALGAASLPRALLAAGVALALQVGVNFANDYSDGVRGTDAVRSGPPRLTGGGLVAPRTVRRAAFASFGIAAVLGLVLVALSGAWWLVAAGGAAVVAAWYYTGGRRPYGYMGLGEVFVFTFFGLMATLGTTWTQAAAVDAATWLGAAGVGLIACALLMVNNIRDIPTDALVGKHTLAVRLGDRRARWTYTAMVAVPLLLGLGATSRYPWAWLVVGLVPAAVALARPVLAGRSGRALIPVLRNTGFYEIAYALVLGAGLVL